MQRGDQFSTTNIYWKTTMCQTCSWRWGVQRPVRWHFHFQGAARAAGEGASLGPSVRTTATLVLLTTEFWCWALQVCSGMTIPHPHPHPQRPDHVACLSQWNVNKSQPCYSQVGAVRVGEWFAIVLGWGFVSLPKFTRWNVIANIMAY